MIRNHIISELQEFNSVNNEIISDTVNKMKHVLHPISKFKIFTKIESISVPFTYYFEVKFHNPLNIKKFDDPSKYGINGSSKGNVYYTEMRLPRLEDSYLRYSCPTYFSKDEQFISQLFVLNSSAICITIGGGCHLIDNADTCYFGSPVPTLLFLPKETFYEDKLSIKHVIAWLKSNISIWVQLQKTGSSDFINPRTIDNMLLPYGSDFYKNNSILELVNKILNLEHVFLQQSHQFNNQKNNTSSNSTENLCIKHNNKVNKIAYEIEETIRNFMEITDEENELIYSDLNADNVYLYNKEG